VTNNNVLYLHTAISKNKKMETLFEKHHQKIAYTSLRFTRSLMDNIHWDARLIGIRGARGVGKTTLLLQYIKKNLPQDSTVLYVSLDDIWFSEHKLVELADTFSKRGGLYLFLDEVHKYPDWSQELKNIYDDHPQLKIVFTGSSLLGLLNARADLSRRAIVYDMQGLSFREYLGIVTGVSLPVYTLINILENHTKISQVVLSQLKPLQHFDAYLRKGYYPFFLEVPELYYIRIEEVINMILDVELPLLRGMDISYVPKLKQLLLIIAESVPFIPNVSKLSERIGINRTTFMAYLYYLQEAHITKHLYRSITGIARLQKPDKIFLENTNLQYAFASDNADTGNIRETFFFNQVSYKHKVELPQEGDFVVDGKYLFEVGGKGKGFSQIAGYDSRYVVADNLEYGAGDKIPLWQFGFLS
jgi:Predicted ATPase (AAA+ superfamily)